MTPKLFVVTGPFGAGIPELVDKLMNTRGDLSAVTPVTARKMKSNEQDGVGFYFYDLDGWNALKEAGDLLETTELAGNDYGTSRRLVQETFAQGKNVILSVEPERAVQVKQNMPEAVCIWVEPSTPEILEERYRGVVRNRYELTARVELAAEQRKFASLCDECIASDDAETALAALNRLVETAGA